MKPQFEQKLFSTGCLLVLIGFFVFCYLAVTSHWEYIAAAFGLMGGWLLICQRRMRRDRQRTLGVLREVFDRSGRPLPRLEQGSQYGYPSFRLIFQSEAELQQATESGSVGAFKQAIQSLYGHTGSKKRPFEAERAVWATYEGWRWQAPSDKT